MKYDKDNNSHYTEHVFVISVIIVFVIYIFFGTFVYNYIIIHIAEPVNCSGLSCVTAAYFMIDYLEENPAAYNWSRIGLTCLGLAGALALWASLQLDSGDENATKHANSIFIRIIIFVMLYWVSDWTFTYLGGWLVYNNNPHNEVSGILRPISAILALLFFIPYLFFRYAFIPGALIIGLSGLLCLPRAIIFATTRSKLRPAVARLQANQPNTAENMAGVFGEKSRSRSHALALRLDTENEIKKVKTKIKQLREDTSKKSADLHADLARHQAELELSRLLREAETKRAEIEAIDRAKAEFQKWKRRK